jgi:hypothetical protein
MTASTGHAVRGFDRAEEIVPKRRPGYLGSIHVLQLMLVELVAISLLLTITRDRSIAVRVLWLAAVVLTIILGRRGGRWWLEQQIVLWEYRRRKRTRAAAQPDSHLGAMRLLAPEAPSTTTSRTGMARRSASRVTRRDGSPLLRSSVHLHGKFRCRCILSSTGSPARARRG